MAMGPGKIGEAEEGGIMPEGAIEEALEVEVLDLPTSRLATEDILWGIPDSWDPRTQNLALSMPVRNRMGILYPIIRRYNSLNILPISVKIMDSKPPTLLRTALRSILR